MIALYTVCFQTVVLLLLSLLSELYSSLEGSHNGCMYTRYTLRKVSIFALLSILSFIFIVCTALLICFAGSQKISVKNLILVGQTVPEQFQR